MARSMLSRGMLLARALTTAVRRRALLSKSPPPRRADTVISFANLVNILPRLASWAPLRCWIFFHLLWPAILVPFLLPNSVAEVFDLLALFFDIGHCFYANLDMKVNKLSTHLAVAFLGFYAL